MSLLEISTPDFSARNLRRDGQNGNATALAIVKAIDQMHVSGPAASSAYSQFASEMRLCARRERGCLLMARANPLDVPAGANRIRYAIERVAGDAVNSLNARSQQDVHKQVSHSLGHFIPFSNP
jgi:hypothetical protein